MWKRAHIVEPIGKLDQQDTHVAGDCKEQPAQVFRLLGFFGDEVEFLELGKSLHKCPDVPAEHLVDLGAGRFRVLNRIVHEGSSDGRVVELEVGQDRGHFERMRELRIPRGPRLLAVGAHGVDVGPVEKGLVRCRIVTLHALNELVLPHHMRLLSGH